MERNSAMTMCSLFLLNVSMQTTDTALWLASRCRAVNTMKRPHTKLGIIYRGGWREEDEEKGGRGK